MTLSGHQQLCIVSMRQGLPLYQVTMHIRTVLRLLKLKLITRAENGTYILIDLGETTADKILQINASLSNTTIL